MVAFEPNAGPGWRQVAAHGAAETAASRPAKTPPSGSSRVHFGLQRFAWGGARSNTQWDLTIRRHASAETHGSERRFAGHLESHECALGGGPVNAERAYSTQDVILPRTHASAAGRARGSREGSVACPAAVARSRRLFLRVAHCSPDERLRSAAKPRGAVSMSANARA